MMPVHLFNNLLDIRTLEETLKLAHLYSIMEYTKAEYEQAEAAKLETATQLGVKMIKARLAYTDAVAARD